MGGIWTSFRWLRATAGAAAILAAVSGGSATYTSIAFFPAAQAAAPLTSDQLAAIQTAVNTALANVNPALTGAARDQAVAAALAQATSSQIALYGASALSAVTSAAIAAGVPAAQVVAAVLPAAVTAGIPGSDAVASISLAAINAGASPTQVSEAVIATAVTAQISASDVGTGLGATAAAVSQTNPDGANAIAQVISNEGTSGMSQSFASSVTDHGGSQQLAQAGSQNPQATGETNNNTNGNEGTTQNGQQQGSGGTTLPTCSNPSCT